jgi:hypothetical protein
MLFDGSTQPLSASNNELPGSVKQSAEAPLKIER